MISDDIEFELVNDANSIMFSKVYEESNKLVDYPTIIKLLGDKTTICQVIQLLAYIRHAILNNKKTKIEVNIGENIANGKLLFDVNGQEIRDFIDKPNISIN